MEKSIFDRFNDDDVYKIFTEEGFDAKAYATKVIEGHAISQQLAVLAEGINLVDKELHKQVVEHHEDLLSQAVGIETLEGVLQSIQARSQNLMAAVERIRSRVSDPYNKIVARNDQLKRLQETCDTLRQIIRAIYLSKRLRSQLQGGLKEITKAAQCLNELDYLATNGVDLSGIEAIESDRKFVKQARKEVEMQSQKMLRSGLQLQNQTQIATSLQIFYNLNILEQTIDSIIVEVTEDVREITRNSLDINYLLSFNERKSGPGKVSGLSTGNTAAFRASLWMNMEKLADAMFSSYSQIFQLQKVLTRKRDPATHILFIDHYKQAKGENSGNLLQEIWKNMTAILKEEFKKTAENNTFLKQALEGEYPKQLRLFNDLWKRISSLAVTSSDHGLAESSDSEKGTLYDNYNPEKALNDCFTQFETAYLSKSLSRLFDPINLVFSSSSSSNLPSSSDLEGIVKTINSELTVSSFDTKLCASVARNVSKTIVLFCSKFEQLLMTGSDVTQVIGPPTDAQSFNASIVNSLHKFYQATAKGLSTLQNIPPQVHEVINDALQGVLELMGNIVEPVLTSISQAIEDILLTMHNEDFSQASQSSTFQTDGQHCSLYMKELQQFINRAVSSYVAQFQCSELVLAKLKIVAQRCLELFVRHTSLVHPLGEGGKMRLANDYAQVEVVVAHLCNKLSDLGKSYRVVRAVRPMLFQAPEHVVKNTSVGEVVPISIILHFFFARGYPQLRPAYQTAGWTCSRYSKWLDEHPNERDRLKFIKGSLESYAQVVTSRGGKEFVPIYPFMIDLLQRGLQ